MAQHSDFLAALDAPDRAELEHRLLERQSGHCFICPDSIDTRSTPVSREVGAWTAFVLMVAVLVAAGP
jgi:hypothetical protein